MHAPVPELLLDKAGGPRVSLEPWAAVQCILAPWGLFAGIFYLMSFTARYQHAELVWTLLFFGLAIPAVLGARVYSQWRRASARGTAMEPSWYPFLAATCLLAWTLGLALGNANYAAMTSYYDYTGLSFPRGIDPRDIPGTHYLDSGGIYFAEGARVNQSLALGFKDGSTYCVAPITMGGTKVASYDFWAVGVDCCVPLPPARFWCGAPPSGGKMAGLRFTGDEEEKNKYKLAIQQAMAEYHIMAKDPLLFTMTHDPLEELEAVRTGARNAFTGWMLAYLAVQTALAGAAVVFYQKQRM